MLDTAIACRSSLSLARVSARKKPVDLASGFRSFSGRLARSAQSKWGRHYCRPHSHRCVVLSEDRSLASDVFPSFHRSGCPVPSPALAPASGSGRVRSVYLRASPRSRFPSPSGSETVPTLVAFASSGLHTLRPCIPSAPAGLSGHDGSAFAFPSTTDLARAGAFCNAGLQDRADNHRHIGLDLNCLFDQAVRLVRMRLFHSVPTS